MTERPVDTLPVCRAVVHLDFHVGRRDVAPPLALNAVVDEHVNALRERKDVLTPDCLVAEVAQRNPSVDERGCDSERQAELRVDDRVLPAQDPLLLPAGTRRLELHFAGLSYGVDRDRQRLREYGGA